jgi:hypothetical protein
MLLIEESAYGGWGIGDNVLTLTTRNEPDRGPGRRGAFWSYDALNITR